MFELKFFLKKVYHYKVYFFLIEQVKMEMPGIDPGTSRMQSERSTK